MTTLNPAIHQINSQHNVHVISTQSNKQDKIDFLVYQMLDSTY